MRLQPGDAFQDPSPGTPRASSRDRPSYVVTGVIEETPWRGLYKGKKLFTSFHFGRRALEEAPTEEGLDVFLETLEYTRLDDRESIKERRELAYFQVHRVLGRMRKRRAADDETSVVGRPLSNLLPEPIDFLQVPNTRDTFAVNHARQLAQFEPVIITECVHGDPLETWRAQVQPSPARCLRVLADLLDFLAVVHLEELLLNGPDPAEIWIDGTDRLHYLAGHRVLGLNKQGKQRSSFPAERYPGGFAAPELLLPGEEVTAATDLYGWAALAYYLLTGDSARGIQQFESSHFAQVEKVLARIDRQEASRLGQVFRISGPSFSQHWQEGFLVMLRACLQPRREDRPNSVEAALALWSAVCAREPMTTCAVCALELPVSGLDAHLEKKHGHVRVDSQLVPYGKALEILWPRFLVQQEVAAAQTLAELFAARQDSDHAAFANALVRQLALHMGQIGPMGDETNPGKQWDALGRCLGSHDLLLQACRQLLQNDQAGVRRVGRLGLVPVLARTLTGKNSVTAFRKAIELLCDREDVETRLIVCDRLQAAGASAQASQKVRKELAEDRVNKCSLCGLPLPHHAWAEHMRLVHGAYEVHGQILGWNEALEALLSRMVAARPDVKAAQTYLQVASNRLSAPEIAERLARDLSKEASARGRVPPLDAIQGLVLAPEVCRHLLASDGQARLGLALFVKLGRKAPPGLAERVIPWLGDASMPLVGRRLALLEIYRAGKLARTDLRQQALERFLAGISDPLAQLDQIEQLAAERLAGLDEHRSRLRAGTFTCSACPTTGTLDQVESHAWDSHRLVLDSGRWRPVWEVIEEKLDQFGRDRKEEVLRQAIELARRDNPQTGPGRLANLARRRDLHHRLLTPTRKPDLDHLIRLQRYLICAAVILGVLLLWWLFR